jgi:hypothetical protein
MVIYATVFLKFLSWDFYEALYVEYVLKTESPSDISLHAKYMQ